VRIDDLRHCLATAFERLQLTPAGAEGLSGLLVESELRGHPDHGVAALGALAGFYRDGTLNPRPRVRVLHETDGAILFDGDHGSGPGAPTRAMRWCIERARERKGMAVAAVRDWQLLVAAPTPGWRPRPARSASRAPTSSRWSPRPADGPRCSAPTPSPTACPPSAITQ
jgi:LDH2 family malate/lactate/ureidoglycolate dehydrogenase